MSETKDQKPTNESKSAKCNCGCQEVMLTEEKNAVPRCAGCGKPVVKKG